MVRTGLETDAHAAARLHADQIGEGFLSSLGPRFLTVLYRRVVRWPRSFLLVAEEGGQPVGHAAATEDVGGLYRQFLLHDGLVAGAVAAPRLARHWRRALETLRYPSGHDQLPSAELLAVAVASEFRGRGIGRSLVVALNDELVRRGIDDARVVVAAANGPALALYRSSGFRSATSIQLHADRRSEVLTWS
ncbi:MAG: GNAT family N-acetyltransferase [Actinobacteria bacterium]|nr:GNAT family N-acetyltransferase [Actinomycetota bacterium]